MSINPNFQKLNISLSLNSKKNHPAAHFQKTIAQLLDPLLSPSFLGKDGGPLEKLLQSGTISNLREAVLGLSLYQRKQLLQRVPPPVLDHFLSISNEPYPRIFWERMFTLGENLKNEGKSELAKAIFAVMVKCCPPVYPPLKNERQRGFANISPQLIQKANASLRLLQGQGSLADQVEYSLSRFLPNSLDKNMIVPMIFASMVGKAVGTWALGRIAFGRGFARYLPAFLQRGLGARFTASVTGLLFETPVFFTSSRVLRQMDGARLPSDPHSIGKELLSSAMTLGILRLSGFAGNQVFLGIHRFNELGVAAQLTQLQRFTKVLIPYGSMYFGMLFSHQLEAKLNLRPETNAVASAIGAMESLISLTIGGKLGHWALGSRMARLEQNWGMKTGIYTKILEEGDTFLSPFGKLPIPLNAHALGGSKSFNLKIEKETPLSMIGTNTLMIREESGSSGTEPPQSPSYTLGNMLIDARRILKNNSDSKVTLSLREIQRIQKHLKLFGDTQGTTRALANALWLTMGASLKADQHKERWGVYLKELMGKVENPERSSHEFQTELKKVIQPPPHHAQKSPIAAIKSELEKNLEVLKGVLGKDVTIQKLPIYSDSEAPLLSAYQLLDQLVQTLAISRFVLISGPSDSAKGKVGGHLGKILDWETTLFNIHLQTSQSEMMETLKDALIHGKLFIAQGIRYLKGDSLNFLRSVLEEGKETFDAYNVKKGKVENHRIHPSFRMIGIPKEIMPGEKEIDSGLKDRAIKLEAPPFSQPELSAFIRNKFPDLERMADAGFVDSIVQFYQGIAKSLESSEIGYVQGGYVWNLQHLMRLTESFISDSNNPMGKEGRGELEPGIYSDLVKLDRNRDTTDIILRAALQGTFAKGLDKLSISQLLSSRDPKLGFNLLLQLGNDPNPSIQITAAESLSRLGELLRGPFRQNAIGQAWKILKGLLEKSIEFKLQIIDSMIDLCEKFPEEIDPLGLTYAVNTLGESFNDKDRMVRIGAAKILIRLSKWLEGNAKVAAQSQAFAILNPLTKYVDWEMRKVAGKALSFIKEELSWLIVHPYETRDWQVQAYAAEALGLLGERLTGDIKPSALNQAFQTLKTLGQRKNPDIKYRVLTSFIHLSEQLTGEAKDMAIIEAFEVFSTLIKSKEGDYLLKGAVEFLGQLNKQLKGEEKYDVIGRRAYHVLVELLKNKDPYVKISVAEALVNLNGQLKGEIKDSALTMALNTLRALSLDTGSHEGKTAIKSLVLLSKHFPKEVNQATFTQALQVLRQNSEEPNSVLRGEALEVINLLIDHFEGKGIKKSSWTEVAVFLKKLCKDKEWGIRRRAAPALDRLIRRYPEQDDQVGGEISSILQKFYKLEAGFSTYVAHILKFEPGQEVGKKDGGPSPKNQGTPFLGSSVSNLELVALLRRNYSNLESFFGINFAKSLMGFYRLIENKLRLGEMGESEGGYEWGLHHFNRIADGFEKLAENQRVEKVENDIFKQRILQTLFDAIGVTFTPKDREHFFEAMKGLQLGEFKITTEDILKFNREIHEWTFQKVFKEFKIKTEKGSELAKQAGVMDTPTSARFLRSILKSLKSGNHPWLRGPTGTGKTKLAEFAAKLLGAKVYTDTLTTQTDERPYSLVKALRNKTSELSICILDQAAITKPEAIEDLKTLLDQNGGIWVLKEDGSEKEFLRRSKNFRLIIVGPSGLPSQNDPFRSQMQEIFMDFEYNAQELDVLFGLKE